MSSIYGLNACSSCYPLIPCATTTCIDGTCLPFYASNAVTTLSDCICRSSFDQWQTLLSCVLQSCDSYNPTLESSVFSGASSYCGYTATNTITPTSSSGLTLSSRASPSVTPPITTPLTPSTSTSSYSYNASTSSYLYNGSGPLLTGTCATAEFTYFLDAHSTEIIFAQVVGCVNDKPDCCPFRVATTTSTTTATVSETTTTTETTIATETTPATETIPVTNTTLVTETTPATGTITGTVIVILSSTVGNNSISVQPTQFGFPSPNAPNKTALSNCPADYQTISSVCCPSGYLLWNSPLGTVTPCFSTLSTTAAPPPLPESLTVTVSGTPITKTVEIDNIVYSMPYQVNSTDNSGLSTAVKGGIGGAAAGVALICVALIGTYIRRKRPRISDRPTPGNPHETLPDID